jgi:hypothetical protein
VEVYSNFAGTWEMEASGNKKLLPSREELRKKLYIKVRR